MGNPVIALIMNGAFIACDHGIQMLQQDHIVADFIRFPLPVLFQCFGESAHIIRTFHFLDVAKADVHCLVEAGFHQIEYIKRRIDAVSVLRIALRLDDTLFLIIADHLTG